jgi:hypothetical protein
MAWPGPPPTWRRLAEGASIGAGTALALIAAEVATGMALGAPFPPRAWAFHALYLFPLVAPALGLAQGFRFLDVRPSPRALTPRYRTLLQRVQGLLPRALLAEPLRATFPSAVRSAEEITDRALDWLGRRPRGQPYLLFSNYMVPASRPDDARRMARDLERWRAGRATPSLPAVAADAGREEALAALGCVQ